MYSRPSNLPQAIQELREKAKLYEATGIIPVMDHAIAAVKSDSAISSELQAELKRAAAPLEDVPEHEKDWHPRSDNKVLDLVHPSLWPLVYGRSRILPEETLTLENCFNACGAGIVIPKPSQKDLEVINSGQFNGLVSPHYQWLPCEVDIQGSKAKIVSYINTLHPTHHQELYSVIEKVIEKSLPLWDVVHRWPKEFHRHRINVTKALRICNAPEVCGKDSWECQPESRPLEEGEEPRPDEDEYWDLEHDDPLKIKDREWFDQTHPCETEDPEEYTPGKIQAADVRSFGFFDNVERIQVIVKLANIHLTPEKPTYEGGSWHIEGQHNERICATALYYYDCENVTDSYLSLRNQGDTGEWHVDLGYNQHDHESIRRVFSIDPAGPTLQTVGRVLTREGRLLTFPNLYQHCVSPFELADKTKPGHRKILALFLVDPAVPIISTANVPPQQQHWWAQGLEPKDGDRPRLPAELRTMVRDSMDWPIGLEEAKATRLELMDERSALNQKGDEQLSYIEWGFCEH